MNNINRRDFLKVVGVGLASAAAEGLGLGNAIRAQAEKYPAIENGLRVSAEIAKAELSQDSSKIAEARQLAIFWAFAESASVLSKNVGMEKAGKTIEHYLHGNGQALDISPWLEEVIGQESFWQGLTKQAANHYYATVTEDYHGEPIVMTPQKFTNVLANLSRRLSSGYTFTGRVENDTSTQDRSKDWLHAIGFSTYTIRGDAMVTQQEGQVGMSFHNMEVTLRDVYDWNALGVDAVLDKGRLFALNMTDPLLNQFLQSEENITPLLEKLDISAEKKTDIMQAFKSMRAQAKETVATSINAATLNLLKWSTETPQGRVVSDINVLRKIGAQDYQIEGHAQLNHPLQIVLKQ